MTYNELISILKLPILCDADVNAIKLLDYFTLFNHPERTNEAIFQLSLKKAFNELILLVHPDKTNHDAHKTQIFLFIYGAKEILENPAKRNEYASRINPLFPTPHPRQNSPVEDSFTAPTAQAFFFRYQRQRQPTQENTDSIIIRILKVSAGMEAERKEKIENFIQYYLHNRPWAGNVFLRQQMKVLDTIKLSIFHAAYTSIQKGKNYSKDSYHIAVVASKEFSATDEELRQICTQYLEKNQDNEIILEIKEQKNSCFCL